MKSRWLDHASSLASKNERSIIIALAVDFGIHSLRNRPISWRADRYLSSTSHYLAGVMSLPSHAVRYPKLTKMRVGGINYQKSQIMLKAVATLRNCSLDMSYVYPKCSKGHLALWEAQLESRGLLPFESAVRDCDLSGLMEALKILAIPEFVPDCGCRGFTPSLPQDLCDVVCLTFDTSCS